MRYCKRKQTVISLHRGPFGGTCRGFVYWDVMSVKENAYLDSLSRTQRTLIIQSVGQLELLQNNRAPLC